MDLKDTFLKNELEKKDSALLPFFTDKISYGVDGIKSKLGAGTSQINEFTIAASISAYAKFILKTGIKKEIVIGHDNRKNSKLFAEVAASVLMSNGIKAYLYEENELQPAPVISYTIRKKKLGGGINITASCDSKDFNGIKIYNQFGGQLVFDDIKLIQSFMKDIDPLLVDRSQDIPPVIQKSIIEKYIDDVKSIELNKGDKTNIKVAYSAQHGAGAVIVPKVLKNLGVDISIVEKQNNPDPDFKNTKSPNPADGKSFRKVESLARKTKADLFFVTDPTASHLGVAVKYKRRYKYLSGNQMSTIYLDYRLSQLKKNGMIPKDSYIVTTIASSHLPEKIAKKYGVRTLKTHVGFQNIADIVENSKGTFLFAFEESQGCLIDANISREGDAIQTAVGIVDMISYYKTQGINPFEKLKDIYENYNIHRTTNFTRNITTNSLRSLKKAIKKTKYIGELKVKKIADYSKTNEFGKSDVMEMIFENESRIIFKPSENKEKVKVYVEAVSNKKQNLEDIVWFEKEVNIFVGNNTDDVKEPTLSWKGALKYLIFIGLIVGITAIVFFKIYKDGSTTTGSVASMTIAGNIANSINRWIFLSIWIWRVCSIWLSAWMKKRMFDIQGVKVKVKHLAISSLMGSVISFVTPFAVGGDAIGYWYMRKKGIERGSIVATFASSTLISEAKFTLQTVLLLGIGWALYSHIFNDSTDLEARGALIWFIAGSSWMVFATMMIFMLTLSKRIQEFLFLTALKVAEWFPYYHVYDPAGLAGTFQYEFRSLRIGMKQIWTKWWFIFEILFYTAIPLLFNPGSIMLMESGWINPNVPSGQYWSQIVANDIVGTANSMSLTPGGTGTGEWLAVHTKGIIYQNSIMSNVFGYSSSGKAISSGIDIVWKFFYDWPMLIFSTALIFIVLFIEKRKKNIDIINKSNRISNLAERNQTKSRILGILLMGIIILTFFMLLLFVLLK